MAASCDACLSGCGFQPWLDATAWPPASTGATSINAFHESSESSIRGEARQLVQRPDSVFLIKGSLLKAASFFLFFPYTPTLPP